MPDKEKPGQGLEGSNQNALKKEPSASELLDSLKNTIGTAGTLKPEQPHEEDTPLPEVRESFLGDLFGHEPFKTAESDDQEVDLDLKEDGSLSFNKEVLDEAEKKTIEEFLQAMQSPNGIAGTRFAWFFENESPEFLAGLQEALNEKVGKDNASLENLSLDSELRSRVESAAKAFREMGKRQEISRALKDQAPLLPFDTIDIRNTRTGEETKVTFNAREILAGNSKFDFVYVNNSGSPELLISIKDPAYEIIGMTVSDDDELIADGKFIASGVSKFEDKNLGDGVDSSRFTIDIDRGGSKVPPIFKTVQVFMKPMSLEKEIDEMIAQQKEEEARAAEIARRAQQNSYSGTPPSVPSTPIAPQVPKPNWQQEPSHVRSG